MERTCKYCGRSFKCRPMDIERGHGKYCSNSCRGKDYGFGGKKIAYSTDKPINNNPSIEERKAIALDALAKMDKNKLDKPIFDDIVYEYDN